MSNGIRLNFNAYEGGEEYLSRLSSESDKNFKLFLSLLSSYWKSTIDGPNYTRSIRAMAVSLAQIRLALEDIQLDGGFATTRGEYLHQIITSVVFPDKAPDLQTSDIEFRDFLRKVVNIYFQGSTPESVKNAVELVTNGRVLVKEGSIESRRENSGFDISDEFTLEIDVILSVNNPDTLLADRNVRTLLNIVRPAHTLFRMKYVLEDEYEGVRTVFRPEKIIDNLFSSISAYGYEDFRKFSDGIEGVDEEGAKRRMDVVGESHTGEF